MSLVFHDTQHLPCCELIQAACHWPATHGMYPHLNKSLKDGISHSFFARPLCMQTQASAWAHAPARAGCSHGTTQSTVPEGRVTWLWHSHLQVRAHAGHLLAHGHQGAAGVLLPLVVGCGLGGLAHVLLAALDKVHGVILVCLDAHEVVFVAQACVQARRRGQGRGSRY